MPRWPNTNVTREQRPWTRMVEERIVAIEKMLGRISDGLTNTSSNAGSLNVSRQVSKLNDLAASSAVPYGRAAKATEFNLDTNFGEVISIDLDIPEGKKSAALTIAVDGHIKSAAQVTTILTIAGVNTTQREAILLGESNLVVRNHATVVTGLVAQAEYDALDPTERFPLTIALSAKAAAEVVSDPASYLALTVTASFFNE